MTKEQIEKNINELVALVQEGKPMDAFEKFYADNLHKADLDGKLVVGKDANREIGNELMANVKEIRDFSYVGHVIKGSRSFLIWSLDFDHKTNGTVKVTQVAIQDWEDGKIVRELFHT